MANNPRREIDLLGTTVEYEVRCSSDATEPRIDVDIHGVTVVIPESEDTQPAALLKENAAWVIKKKRKYDAYQERVPDRQFENGASFPYLGNQHEVVIEPRSSSTVVDSTLRLAEHHVEKTSVKRALETLYRRKARETFQERADHYAAEMDVEYKQLDVRNQRTKWGSCSTTGTLGLNWRLMMAPLDVVDYIIIHELAHIREPNHTDAFWSVVADHDSSYEDHARWLKEHSTRLIFSDKDV